MPSGVGTARTIETDRIPCRYALIGTSVRIGQDVWWSSRGIGYRPIVHSLGVGRPNSDRPTGDNGWSAADNAGVRVEQNPGQGGFQPPRRSVPGSPDAAGTVIGVIATF